jgi:hypothetical protein
VVLSPKHNDEQMVCVAMIHTDHTLQWITDDMEFRGIRENFMTKPIDLDSPFWNTLEKLTRIMAVTFLPWATWMTWTVWQHTSFLELNSERWKAHQEYSKSKVDQIEQMDRESQEWKLRMTAFTEETRAGIRATDVSIRDVGARLGAMADTTSRIQEGLAAIREKMVSLQIVTDELNKEKK